MGSGTSKAAPSRNAADSLQADEPAHTSDSESDDVESSSDDEDREQLLERLREEIHARKNLQKEVSKLEEELSATAMAMKEKEALHRKEISDLQLKLCRSEQRERNKIESLQTDLWETLAEIDIDSRTNAKHTTAVNSNRRLIAT